MRNLIKLHKIDYLCKSDSFKIACFHFLCLIILSKSSRFSQMARLISMYNKNEGGDPHERNSSVSFQWFIRRYVIIPREPLLLIIHH